MVFRVVSAITQQLGHSVMCVSSLARISESSDSSRKSLSSRKKSLQVSKGVVSFALEESCQLLTQLQAGAEQPAFDCRDGKSESLGRLLGGKLVDIAQHEHGAIGRFQALDRGVEDFAQLLAGEALFGIFAPRGDLADEGVLTG